MPKNAKVLADKLVNHNMLEISKKRNTAAPPSPPPPLQTQSWNILAAKSYGVRREDPDWANLAEITKASEKGNEQLRLRATAGLSAI